MNKRSKNMILFNSCFYMIPWEAGSIDFYKFENEIQFLSYHEKIRKLKANTFFLKFIPYSKRIYWFDDQTKLKK